MRYSRLPVCLTLILVGISLAHVQGVAQGSALGGRIASREYPISLIEHRCIGFRNVKRGTGPADYRDCRVSEFGELGSVDDEVYYYAAYCLIPTYAHQGICGDSSFNARYHRSRALAIFVRPASSRHPRLLLERASVEIANQYFEKPAIVRNAAGTLLYIPIAVDGTGHDNQSEYYLRRRRRWDRIDAEAWLRDLSTRIPPGVELWKGVWPDVNTMRAEAYLYRSDDGNCCPTGGTAHIKLLVRANKFVIDSVTVDTKILH